MSRGWRSTYDLIVELRKDRTAVVDAMGSEALAEGDGETRNYQTLISLMLSSQTKDTTTAKTMRKLRDHGLSLESILATEDAELNGLIREVGFHNRKTTYLKETSRILKEKHDSKVPRTMEELCALPGVGPKMALIVLKVNYGIVDGIAVDTHVHRICNQLGWCDAKQPEQTRKAIETLMPRDIWPDVNLVLVGFGQELQTEKKKLLEKCLNSSDPGAALALVTKLGLVPSKEFARHEDDLRPLVMALPEDTRAAFFSPPSSSSASASASGEKKKKSPASSAKKRKRTTTQAEEDAAPQLIAS
eukprot:CAMPEP_0118902714 /NCGR_PEP_ID=MMETSP1166-20130328/7880_1 /TAXON_ID=1104430 /ORGANISM="Chrysoreinhardia sp, Strain CCMP3193" /LENGTH=302 /DNA_ID=CAMNT_0006841927 /DNA_START=50 /DNA_END=958 /DNA_ORIENTATION=-